MSNPELFNKCTHGLTQNVNECLNGLIWDRCPKSVYAEQETVPLATFQAVLKFNDGDISVLKLFSDRDITPCIFTGKGAGDSYNSRTNQNVFDISSVGRSTYEYKSVNHGECLL